MDIITRKFFKFLSVVLVLASAAAIAQPTVLGTQIVNGTYTTYNLNTVGAFKQIRLQASTAAATGTRNWEFATGTAASTNYTTNWRPYTGGNTMSVNTFIPTSFANGAKYNTGSGGASGLLPAITNGRYYTFNVSNNSAADNVMSLLETTFNPVTISSVTRDGGGVTITTSGTPNAAEFIYVRYSTDSFATSTLVQAAGSGTTWGASIPVTSGSVSFYVYTSNRTLAAINADVATYGQQVHDMSTLNLNNNSGSNYSYTASNIAFNVITDSDPSASNPYTTGQVVNANATFTGIGRGTGIAAVTSVSRYNASGWDSGSLNVNDYYEFTITPSSGYKINFTDFTYTIQSSNSGAATFSLRSSLDSYGSTIGSITNATGNTTSGSVSLVAANYQSLTSPITFRLYGWGASQSTGTFSVNDFSFNGTVAAISVNPVLAITGTTAHGSTCPNVAATPISYTITNTGSSAATGVTVVSNDPQFVVSGLSSTTIAGLGGTATYNVTFTPSSAGSKSATITVASVTSGSNSPTSLLSGTGITPVTPVVTASAATSVVNTTAILNGNVTTLGVCPATTEKGFVYSLTATNSNPIVGGSGVTKTSVAGVATGAYTLNLSSLVANSGYTFKAYVYDGTTYTYSTAQIFTTLAAANHLVFVSVPSSGFVSTPFSFTVEAQRADNTVDTEYAGNVTISKASGPGTLSGTLTVAASAGVASFTTPQVNATGTYTLNADSGALPQITSGNIVIGSAPVTLGTYTFTGTACSVGALAPSSVATGLNFSQASVTGESCNANSATSYSIGGTSWGTSFSATRYAQIIVTPNTGYSMSLSNISLDALRSGAGATNISIRSSVDNYATDLLAPATVGTSTANYSQNLSFNNVTSGITFRIYGWGGNSTGDLRLDNITLKGNASCVVPVDFTVTGGGSYCSGGSGVTIGLSGSQGGLSYQLKRNGSNVNAPVNGTGSAISFGNVVSAGFYTVVATNSGSGCSATLTMGNTVTVSVDTGAIPGTISGDTTVCAGTNSTLLSLFDYEGTIQWQSSSDDVTYNDIPGETADTYTATNLTTTTYYRVMVSNGSCPPVASPSVQMFVNPAPVAGTISGAGSVCSGTHSTVLTLNGSAGTRQWQSSSDNTTFNDIPGETGTTYTATNLTATTYYRVVLSSGVCTPVNTPSVTITVNPVSVAGTISGASTVCSGTNSTLLTLNGSTGSSQWQSSSDNVTFNDIPGETGTTYTATNLSATTYYHVVVTSGACTPATTPSVTMTVNPAVVAGTISGAATVCAGTNSTVLTLNGSTGSRQWQSSSDNVTFNDIPGETGTTYTATNLSATTYYRVVVSSGSCTPQNTSSVTMTVNPAAVAGTISGASTVCSGTNSTLLTLNGSTGSSQWQSSSDNVTFNDIPGETGTTYTATNLTATTYYRAVVTSGVCTPATTSSVTMTVNPAAVAGTISGATTVCSGTNSTQLTLNGSTGTIQWQSSPDNFTWANISGETNTTYTATNLTATTYYRAVVSSGVCTPAPSPSVSIMVNSLSVAGDISADQLQVCSGTNSTLLTLSGNTGAIQWQSSSDDVTFNNISGETGQTYTANNLTATTYYRAVVSNGGCTPAATSSLGIDVSPTSVAGSISGAVAVCAGSDVLLSLSGNTGTIQWQSSTDNSTFNNINGETGSTYLAANVTTTTYYRAVVTSGACSSAATASVTVSTGGSTTWDGSAWSNGTPTSTMSAIIAGNYTASSNFTACTLTVNNNAVVDIPSGFNVTLNGALTVSSGSFTLENDANLLQNTNAANSGAIIVKRNSSAIKRQDYTLWSSPVAGQNLLAFSPQTLTNRFYQYNSATNTYNTVASPATTSFNDAQGYLIRVANNHPTFAWIWNGQFSGVPHNGNYSYAMSNGGAGLRFNLVGNPYPSPISAVAFAAQNSGVITQTLYFWRETNNNTLNNAYCSWSPAGGGNGTFVSNGEAQAFDPQGVIQTGQGFFVEATGNAAQVDFNNTMRVANNANQFFRHSSVQTPGQDEAHRIWLNVTSTDGAFCQTAFGYMTGSTNSYDLGIDGKYINSGQTELYSIIDGERYVIQGRALPFDAADTVPLGFKAATAGNYSIAIDHLDGLFAQGQAIYLRDNLTGALHDLGTGAYTFASDAGTFTARFEIVYQSALGNPSHGFDEQQVVIYKQQGSFVVNSGSTVMDEVRVFDIRGRLLLEQKDVNASQTHFTVGEANQVLIVKITSVDGQKVTRKVIN